MRVHVDDLPRIESMSTSSTAKCDAASGYFAFHRSKPASAASLLGEFAMTMSGIFDFRAPVADVAAFFAPLAREGATRGASPPLLLPSPTSSLLSRGRA